MNTTNIVFALAVLAFFGGLIWLFSTLEKGEQQRNLEGYNECINRGNSVVWCVKTFNPNIKHLED